MPADFGSRAVAVSPDGQSVYVANSFSPGAVYQYDVGAGGALSPKSPPAVGAGIYGMGLAVSPDGRSVYVTDHLGPLYQFDVGTGGALSPKSPATVPAGSDPFGVAVSPNGGSVYVANTISNDASQYDVGAGGALSPKSPATVPAAGAAGLAVSPDGRSVYVAGGTVSQFDVGAGGALSPKSPATVAGGDAPVGVAVTPAPRVPTTLSQCRNGGWQQFGFNNQGRCMAFVVLTRICDALERHGIHLKFCPPTPPNPRRPY